MCIAGLFVREKKGRGVEDLNLPTFVVGCPLPFFKFWDSRGSLDAIRCIIMSMIWSILLQIQGQGMWKGIRGGGEGDCAFIVGRSWKRAPEERNHGGGLWVQHIFYLINCSFFLVIEKTGASAAWDLQIGNFQICHGWQISEFRITRREGEGGPYGNLPLRAGGRDFLPDSRSHKRHNLIPDWGTKVCPIQQGFGQLGGLQPPPQPSRPVRPWGRGRGANWP